MHGVLWGYTPLCCAVEMQVNSHDFARYCVVDTKVSFHWYYVPRSGPYEAILWLCFVVDSAISVASVVGITNSRWLLRTTSLSGSTFLVVYTGLKPAVATIKVSFICVVVWFPSEIRAGRIPSTYMLCANAPPSQTGVAFILFHIFLFPYRTINKSRFIFMLKSVFILF